jgi:hypothetical protein
VVGAHLAAVYGVDLAHPLLDEGMTRLALHGFATARGDEIERVPREPRVVDDALAARLL